MSVQIAPHFTSDELNQLAREAGFQKRCSGKIDGSIFLDLIIFNREKLKYQSLNGLSLSLFQNYGIDIKKQSLHERFNTFAVVFLKNVLEELLKTQLNKNELPTSINGFSRILIKDSTCFQVSDNVKETYKGCGGKGSKASVRIQFEFNILSGVISALSLTAYTLQDSTDSKATVELIKPGELIIRDLAYMHADVLKEIIENHAFFVSRLYPCSDIYEKKGNKNVKIDFVKLRLFMLKNKINLLEKEVVVGTETPLNVRLILTLLPGPIVAQRIAKLTLKQRRKGKTKLSKKYTERCFFNLFITNASNAQFPKEAIEPLYKFRWLIELIFKTWKSTWCIHDVKKVNLYRLQCYIYAKLIVIVISWQVIWKLIHQTQKIGQLIPSIDKCSKFLFTNVEKLRDFLFGDIVNIRKFLGLLCIKINQLEMERHGKRPTQLEQIFGWENYCNY